MDVIFKKGVLTLSVIVLALLVFAPMLKPVNATVFGVTSYAVVATAAYSSSFSITLNGIQPCNLIIVFVAKGSCGEAYMAPVTDTAGLDFEIRTSYGGDYYGNGNGNVHVIEFYAKAGSYSGSDTITINEYAAFATDRVIIALAISGTDDAGTNNPFDGAGYKASDVSGTPTVTGVSPTASGELLLGLAGYANSSTAETAETSPLSFSLVAGTQQFSEGGDTPPDNETAVAESAIAHDTGPHTVTWGTPLSDDSGWCMFVDMIKPGLPCLQNVVPEVPYGTIIAATAMIAALASYLLLPKFSRRPKQLSS